ncbi:hypothetical protein STVIR_5056 [Streptomyces viridochromogenes Tue57]|uniref:Uncharacterized protein n=1 Tax=Streptomyces viridochromogenes Tue57 TaxID=1160705 RepID=L8PD23_STRVR|nr:hypothetical protein STVIR_5056 [Streptomyces viridochromogenes Tue57]
MAYPTARLHPRALPSMAAHPSACCALSITLCGGGCGARAGRGRTWVLSARRCDSGHRKSLRVREITGDPLPV